MSIPSIKQAEEHAKVAELEHYTIGCQACKKPLWRVTLGEQYGTRFAAEKIPFEGVPDYDVMCNRKADTIETSCPFCGEDWFKAVEVPPQAPGLKSTAFVIPTILELL